MRRLTIAGEPPLARLLVPAAVGMLAAGAAATAADALRIATTLGAASALVLAAVAVNDARARLVGVAFALATAAYLLVTLLRATPLPPEHVARRADALRARSGATAPSAVEGVVTARHPRGAALLLGIRADRVRSAAGDQATTGLVGVTVAHPRRAWPIGSRVRVVGRLRRPRNFGNPGGYDVERALARHGIFVTMYLWDDDTITLLAPPGGGPVTALARVRDAIASRVAATVAPPARGFLIAVLTGVHGAVDERTRRVLARSGLAHTTSVSGFHIAVVAGAGVLVAAWCLRRSARAMLAVDVWKVAALAGLGPVLLYAALAGESVPAVRSILMYAVVIGALVLDRPPDGLRALAAAAVVLVIAVPDVAADVSFELSFVSVAALILVARRARAAPAASPGRAPRARRLLRLWLVEPLRVSTAAALATAPLTAWHFQQVSLIAPLANVIALPFLGPGALLPGLAALPLLTIAPRVADGLLALAGGSAAVGLRLASACAAVPYAALRTPTPSALELALAYAWLVLAFAAPAIGRRDVTGTIGRRDGAGRRDRDGGELRDGGRTGIVARLLRRVSALRDSPSRGRASARHAVGALVVLLAALTAADVGYWVWERTADPRVRATFLSVGQGDAAVVELPRDGGVLVIDGGGFAGGFDTGERLIAPYLHARKVIRLAALVLSHPQLDHYGGLAALAEQFAPREFWSNGTVADAPGFARLERALDAAGTRRRVLSRATAPFTRGDVTIDVLHPGALAGVDPNNGSLVLRLVHGAVGLLFTGDVEAPAEAQILATGAPLASTVLKVAHHGSATSTSPAFLRAVAPRVAIISAGFDNRFHFPAAIVLRRLADAHATIWRTDVQGAIRVVSDGAHVTVAATR